MAVWTAAGTVRTNKLLVSGVDQIDYAPLDLAPITWTDIAGESWGNLSFTLLDTTSTRALQGGADVQLSINGTRVFGGTLIRKASTRIAGAGRVIECEAVSYDSWLDWRIVPRWSSRTDLGNRIRKLTSDRAMVKDLVERRGGPLLAPNSTVTSTNTDMDVVRVQRKTLREALEMVAAEAQSTASPGKRRFYVDEQLRLHWYSGLEGTAAPYRIADGSYITDVKATAGLIEYWSLREEGGTTFHGSQGVTNLTKNGTITQGVTSIGMVNEPAYRAVTFDGTSGYASGSGAATVGDTWSIEMWVKLTTAGDDGRLYDGGQAGAPLIRTVSGTGAVQVLPEGGSSDILTGAGVLDTNWHHVVVTHLTGNPSTLYIDGASAATGTTRVYSSSDVPTVGASNGATEFLAASAQHVSTYSTAISAATVLAHYRQGISIPPESLMMEDDWGEVLHHGYVVGKNAAGSGWVYNHGSDFERGAVQDFVERERADTNAERGRAGRAAIRARSRIRGLTFQTDVAAAWRSGQTLTVTDDSLGLSGDTFEIRAVNGELAGAVATFDIEAGALRRRLTRRRRRDR